MATPNPTLPSLSEQDISRFRKWLSPEQDTQCLVWQGATDKDGYGYFGAQSRLLRAHRVAYLLHTGRDPGNLLVLHQCDNPPCCNGEHLFLGTDLTNAQDRDTKGRCKIGPRLDKSGSARGARQHLAKLDDDMVRGIFAMQRNGLNASQIARTNRFPVSRRNISYVLNSKTWTHVLD